MARSWSIGLRSLCCRGLIDCHVHLADTGQTANVAEPLLHSPLEIAYIGARNARDTLRAGFTTVHDVGSFRAFADVELRNAIDRGDVAGPRMQAVGAYVTTRGRGRGGDWFFARSAHSGRYARRGGERAG